MKILIGSLLTAATFSAGAQARANEADISLVCTGRAETTEVEVRGSVVLGQDDVVRLNITGETGVAQLPRLIGGRNHHQLSIRDIKTSESEITGKIWYGRIGNAKMRIDRLAGMIVIRGPEGSFSGPCTKHDPRTAPTAAF